MKPTRTIFRATWIAIISIVLSTPAMAQKHAWSKIDGKGAHGWNQSSWSGGAQDMACDQFGNIYSIGTFLGPQYQGGGSLDFGDSVTVSMTTGNYSNPYIVKYNRLGKAQWAREITSNYYLYTTAIALDTGGNAYIIGSTWWQSVTNIAGYNVESYGQGDIWLVKVDKNGNIQWAKTFGGNLQDYPTGITCTPKGDVYITGLFQGYFQYGLSGISGSSQGWSVFLMKLDTDGDPYYARRIATTSGTDAWQSSGGDVVTDRYENVYVSGAFTGSLQGGANIIYAGTTTADQNGFVMKVLPTNGTPMWVRQMGATASALSVDGNGDLYVGGKMASGADTFHNTRLSNSGGIGFDDLYVAQMTKTGTVNWVKRFGDNSTTGTGSGWWWDNQRINISSMDVDHAGKILISGTIDRTTDSTSICQFVVPAFTFTQWSGWWYPTDAFLLKTTSTGACEWNARSGVRDPNTSSGWWWAEKTNGGGVVTDNSGGIYWKSNRTWGSSGQQNDTGKLFFNNDTVNAVSVLGGLSYYSPMLWGIREQWVQVDSFTPSVACPGDSITVYYTKHDPFASGNEFSIKLSNSTGNFFDAITLGKTADTGSGFIKGRLPLQLNRGTGYLLRVDGSAPSVYGYPYETPLHIRAKPATNAGPNDSICFGDSVLLKATGGINFSWYADPYISDSSLQNTDAFPPATHDFIVRSVDAATQCYYLDTVNIRVIPTPEVLPRQDTVMCQGDSVWIYTSGQFGKPAKYSYVWTDMVTNTVLGEGDSFYVAPRVTTPYRVVMYDSCSILRDTAIVTVNVRGHVRGNARPDTTVCIGEPLNIYAQPTGGLSTAYGYRWYVGTDTNVVTTDSAFSWPSMDTTTVFKLITDDGGCSDEMDTSYFTAIRRPTIEVFTRTDTTICNGQSIMLTAFGNGGYPGGYDFRWDNGLPNNDSNLVTPTANSTTYRVILSDACTNTEDTGSITIKLRFPLSLIVRPDTLICRGEPLLLHVDGTGGDSLHYSFDWQNVGIGNDLIVYPTGNTKYKVKLTDNCTLLSTEDSVLVTLRPPLSITTSPDTLICVANTATLRAWGTGGNVPTYSFVWSDGNTETTLPAGTPYMVTPDADHTYSVRLEDNCTVLKDSTTINVTLRDPLSVSTIPTDTTICHGAIAMLQASGTGGRAGYTYTWENVGVGATQNVQPLVDSTFRVIMSDACSPEDTAYVKITIATPLSVQGGGDTLVCPEKRVYIDAEGSGGVASAHVYTWSHGLGTGKVKQVSSDVDMAYVITLSDNCSFSAHDTVYVTMADLPDTDISATITEGCQPLLVTFNSEHVDAGGFSNWQWHFEPKVEESTLVNTATHFFEKSGTFPVKLIVTSSYGCVDSSESLDILVNPKPAAIFEGNPETTTIVEPEVLFMNSSTSSISYEWDFGDNVGTSTAQNPTYTFLDTGHYQVRLIAVSNKNCKDTLVKEYHVQEVYTCFIPSAFSPNGDSHNQKFKVSGTGVKKLRIRIYDRWGALIYESNDPKFEWDGRSQESGELLPMGVYMYSIQVDLENGGREQYKGTVTIIH